MFRKYNVEQISTGAERPELREKLNHFGIDILTEYEVREQAEKSSFFNNLVIPNKQTFLERKTNGQEFSFTEWQKISSNLEKKYSKIEKFVANKVKKHIHMCMEKAIQNVKNMLSKRDKIVLKLFEDLYGKNISLYWSENTFVISLDGYLDFLADKDRYSNEIIFDRLSRAYKKIEDGKNKNPFKFTLLRLMSSLIVEANENLIQTVYTLKNSPKLLKMVLKRNKSLPSFRKDPKSLINIVKYDDKHYNKFSYGRYQAELNLKKEQVVEFAKFYLTSDDKRLNSENVINELCLHLRKYSETDLINKLVLNHHRLYSTVIAGNITTDSYSEHTKIFLRYILSDNNYDKFWELVDVDDNSNFSNAIKIN